MLRRFAASRRFFSSQRLHAVTASLHLNHADFSLEAAISRSVASCVATLSKAFESELRAQLHACSVLVTAPSIAPTTLEGRPVGITQPTVADSHEGRQNGNRVDLEFLPALVQEALETELVRAEAAWNGQLYLPSKSPTSDSISATTTAPGGVLPLIGGVVDGVVDGPPFRISDPQQPAIQMTLFYSTSRVDSSQDGQQGAAMVMPFYCPPDIMERRSSKSVGRWPQKFSSQNESLEPSKSQLAWMERKMKGGMEGGGNGPDWFSDNHFQLDEDLTLSMLKEHYR
jgi:hypothetical protein